MPFAVTQKSLTINSATQKVADSKAVTAPICRSALLAFAIAAISSGATVAPAHAQTSSADTAVSQPRQTRYAIAPGPMAATLNEFASTAGITLSYNPAEVQTLRSNGIQGEYSVAEAFKLLLAGSGLQASRTSSGAYLVAPNPAGAAAPALPAVKVTAGSTLTEAESTVSYNREQLKKIRPVDIKDVFENTASVAVGGSIAANQKVYVRGVEETAMAVTVDGARQNNKVFHHNATNLIDPSLLKTVRASAGISPADDGPGAVGGSIAYETIDVSDALAPGERFGGFADAGYVTNGNVKTTKGALMGRAGGFEMLGYVGRNTGNNYEDGNSNKVRFTEPAMASVLAKIAYESAEIGRFELSHENTDDDASRPYRANLISVQGRPVPESRNYKLDRSNSIFQYSKDGGRGLWNPTAMVAESETEVTTREVPLRDPTTTIVYVGTTDSTSAKFENVFYSGFAAITAGVDYYDDSAVFEYVLDPTIEERAENIGAFVQVRQSPIGVLDLSYGLRYDDQTFTGTDGTDFDEQGASANLSGDIRLGKFVTLNLGYAKVWGGVSLAENYILNGAWDYSSAIVPVESDNYSVGIEASYNGFLFEANVFETDIKDGRTPSWGGGADLVADFVIDGFDVELGYVGERGELTVTYADVESLKDGAIATSYDGNYFTAPLGKLVTLNAEVNFLDARVAFGLTGQRALKNDTVAQNGRVQDGYTVVNAYADYQLHERLSLRVSADNLNDEAYADRASYGQEFVDVVPIYEPGRSVGINLRYEF